MLKRAAQHERYVVKVLEKALRILEVYTRHENAFTLDDLDKKNRPRQIHNLQNRKNYGEEWLYQV